MLAISGGVDSATALWLLKKAGYRLRAMFMKNWEEDDTPSYCHAEKDRMDAAAVCEHLDIELTTLNCAADYWDSVFCEFVAEYAAGHTPNPDVLCNASIKFGAFVDHARRLGCPVIASGHYAHSAYRDAPNSRSIALLSSRDPNKDQTYFLHRLNQSQLAAALFPLGRLTKPQVRSLAQEARLPVHDKRDSTGLCFIGKRALRPFLQRYLLPQQGATPGDIMDIKGNCIGEHQGLAFYTIGQRRGLNIGGIQDEAEGCWYVATKDLQHNRLVVVQGENHPTLWSSRLAADRLHWVRYRPPQTGFPCLARIRHRQPLQVCVVDHSDAKVCRVVFQQPQRAIATGQYVAFYNADECLGGARICAVH